MTEPWTFAGEVSPLDQSGSMVTLVEGSTFCLTDRTGDLWRRTHGLFVLDARLLSHFVLLIDGEPMQPLAVAIDAPYTASFVTRGKPQQGLADSDLLMIRRRYVGGGLREDLELRNAGQRQVSIRIELLVAVDFADIFAVKQGRAEVRNATPPVVEHDALLFTDSISDGGRYARLSFNGSPVLDQDRAAWNVTLGRGEAWSACVALSCGVNSTQVPQRYRCGEPIEHAVPARRMQAWRAETAQIETPQSQLREVLSRSVGDLGSLRVFDPQQEDFPVVAAGAPWYMTLFGRDSLITGWMALLVDPGLAVGALEALARRQGTRSDPRTEEQPGRILHEVRETASGAGSTAGADLYYGTIDATPLFVMLLGEVHRWGLYPERVRNLLPAADRAITWMEDFGDLDGDGFLEYTRSSEMGLLNQGWKDSSDGVPFADGRMPEPPIALCEVQGYAYAAFVARAELADAFAEPEVAAHCRHRAASLKAAFNRDFWMPERAYYALALDGGKRPVDALASNMGHCLWTGIVDASRAATVADHLLSRTMFSGWGLRTLATTMAAYNPLSYHCGSVWPHDTAIIVAGLARYGFIGPAQRVTLGLLAAAERFDGRLPELFAGLDRDEIAVPVSYPSSCSPQAWAAGAPLLMLRSLLRLDPDLAAGRMHLAPALPAGTGPLAIRGVSIGDVRVDIEIDQGGSPTVTGLPDGVEVVRTPMPVRHLPRPNHPESQL